jgi:hypothetical protein
MEYGEFRVQQDKYFKNDFDKEVKKYLGEGKKKK